ncbi:DUF2628 domain-containing protein [Burkholderia dolosa]|uniref:DUF2628 domain-containing protein n=1 Tax=Burkholderia dolosa TaxID=152500 RepID=UPI0020126F3B|nr:DUF2628 domain-containing protein [Burkholderia dolosa]
MSEITTTASSASREEIAAYVGKKAAWYENKWAIAASRKNRLSWNWAACFLGPIWIAYRCMYWQAAAVLGATMRSCSSNCCSSRHTSNPRRSIRSRSRSPSRSAGARTASTGRTSSVGSRSCGRARRRANRCSRC